MALLVTSRGKAEYWYANEFVSQCHPDTWPVSPWTGILTMGKLCHSFSICHATCQQLLLKVRPLQAIDPSLVTSQGLVWEERLCSERREVWLGTESTYTRKGS